MENVRFYERSSGQSYKLFRRILVEILNNYLHDSYAIFGTHGDH